MGGTAAQAKQARFKPNNQAFHSKPRTFGTHFFFVLVRKPLHNKQSKQSSSASSGDLGANVVAVAWSDVAAWVVVVGGPGGLTVKRTVFVSACGVVVWFWSVGKTRYPTE